MVCAAAAKNSTITTPRPAVINSLVRELALMPRMLRSVNSTAKNIAQAAKGTVGTKFIAALLHQITQMIGFKI